MALFLALFSPLAAHVRSLSICIDCSTLGGINDSLKRYAAFCKLKELLGVFPNVTSLSLVNVGRLFMFKTLEQSSYESKLARLLSSMPRLEDATLMQFQEPNISPGIVLQPLNVAELLRQVPLQM